MIHGNVKLQEESSSITAFIDAVWLEDGLAANTLSAYRRDFKNS